MRKPKVGEYWRFKQSINGSHIAKITEVDYEEQRFRGIVVISSNSKSFKVGQNTQDPFKYLYNWEYLPGYNTPLWRILNERT